MAAKITKVMIVRKTGAWGGWKVRTMSEGGRVMGSYEYDQCDLRRAENFWKSEAKRMGAEYLGVHL